jgi:DNA-binding transcriptional ArsR family regulator
MEQPRLSFHLRILKEAGIIVDRRQERWVLYRLNDGDMFLRFLFLAIQEKISPQQACLDLERLNAFGGRDKSCLPKGQQIKPGENGKR